MAEEKFLSGCNAGVGQRLVNGISVSGCNFRLV